MPLIDPRAQDDPAHIALASLVRALDRHAVPYTFTGSFSIGFWAQPRSSKDIDVVVLLEPQPRKRKALLDDLAKEGFDVAAEALQDLDRIHSTALGLRLPNGARVVVELIVPEPERDALTRRIVARARLMPFPGIPEGVRVISPEDLVLYKLLLFRDGSGPFQTDDQRDIRGLLALRRDLEIPYIFLSLDTERSLPAREIARRRRWLVKTLAELGYKRPPPRS